MGYTGEGVKVGVIDQGFAAYIALAGLLEVPPAAGEDCALHEDLPSNCVTGVYSPHFHGSAVTEAIHDIAPDADIYISSINTRGGLYNAVDYMIDQGVDIVNMSLSFAWDGPPDDSESTIISNAIGGSPFHTPAMLR